MASIPVALNQQFLAFLQNAPAQLAKFLEIIKAWYAAQGALPTPYPSTPGGPTVFTPGGTHALQTQEITDEFLESLAKGYAVAVVKEKAIEFVKGFIAGVMIAS